MQVIDNTLAAAKTTSDTEFNLIQKLIKKDNKIALDSRLAEGLDPNLSNRFGWTLLMIATLYDRCDMTNLLLSRGADPKRVNNFGDTADSLAKAKGSKKIS
jgi:ankyrin repeat protein